jgi:hypothetical protein
LVRRIQDDGISIGAAYVDAETEGMRNFLRSRWVCHSECLAFIYAQTMNDE